MRRERGEEGGRRKEEGGKGGGGERMGTSGEIKHLPSKAMCSWFQVFPSAIVVLENNNNNNNKIISKIKLKKG